MGRSDPTRAAHDPDDEAAKRERVLRDQLRRAHQRRQQEERQRRRLEAEKEIRRREAALAKRVRKLERILRDVLRTATPTTEDLRGAVPPVERRPEDEPPAAPKWPDFAPRDLGLFRRFGKRRQTAENEARSSFNAAFEEYKRRSAAVEVRHGRRVADTIAEHERRVRELVERAHRGEPDAVGALAADLVRFPAPLRALLIGGVHARYQPDIRELVVDVALPGRTIVPTEAGWRLGPSERTVQARDRSAHDIAVMYAEVAGQLVLAVLATCFRALDETLVDVVTVNGHDDAAAEQRWSSCVVTVRATRTSFVALYHDGSDPRPDVWRKRLGVRLATDRRPTSSNAAR